MSTPRSVENPNDVRLSPTSARPLPSVCERSAKIGPAEVEVRTGTPPTNWNVSLPLVEPIGMLLMLEASASPIVEISALFSALEAGMKCSPCACSAAGLFGSPEPARKSGSCPSPKMKRSEMRWRRFCACAEGASPKRRVVANAIDRRTARVRAREGMGGGRRGITGATAAAGTAGAQSYPRWEGAATSLAGRLSHRVTHGLP